MNKQRIEKSVAIKPGGGVVYRACKRTLDIFVSLFFVVLFSPVMLLVALLVFIFMGRPALFVQQRPGKEGRPFKLLKFRTMRESVDAQGEPLSDKDRLTRFGRFLRSMSLDELPQLINVLKGDMSLVGPRPLLMRYLPRYSPRQASRMLVQPGITGWAQVHGRNDTTWDDRLRKDVWYVENRSMKLDLGILMQTILLVFKRQGISQKGSNTMSEFMGNAGESENRDEKNSVSNV